MTLSKEEVKCMIFMSGLTDAHKDLRQECLRQLEKARVATPPQDIKLEKLLEECRAILSLKNSSAALANPGQVHAISTRPQKLGDGSSKKHSKLNNFRPRQQNSGNSNSTKTFTGKFQHSQAPVSQKCKRCGQPHAMRDCYYPVDVKCFGCRKHGHTRNICPNSAHSSDQSHAVVSTFSVNGATKEWIWIPLEVNGHQIKLAADSCSHLTIIQLPVWQSLGEPRLEKVGKLVGSFSGHKLKLLGSFKCDVLFRGVTKRLELSVADTEAPSIMGLDWIIPFERATQQPIATTLEMKAPIANQHKRGQYQSKMSQQYSHHHGTRSRSFKSGDSVLVLNYRRSGKPSWLEGKIVSGSGLIWKIEIPILGITVTRHVNQMRSFSPYISSKILSDQNQAAPQQHIPPMASIQNDQGPVHDRDQTPVRDHTPERFKSPRPQRQRKKPDRYSPG
ncbi:hypothetical protein niasHT_006160 [Heterodera trifolii]|uniref:CCHC-type domain-containing protein n=1 Tax=Heterodera trifolii TaxID=157864 RepID=A0ABD2M2G1_9BILA